MPHIAHMMQVLWGSDQCQAYLIGLIMDTRDGKRAGFPYEVFKLIIHFLILHDDLYPEFAPATGMWITGNKIR